MKNSKQIDLVEKSMQDAYSEEVELPDISPAWQTTLMKRITSECTPEDTETRTIETEFLYFSWIAAGIAAALIIISTMIYATGTDSIENNINELYSYTAFDNLTTTMETK